jgi:flavin reductase (DIM6/NTAB) family NADH-FMN oxidoreductase RutF
MAGKNPIQRFARQIRSSGKIIMQCTEFDSQEFRRALGRYATGVTIITARTVDGLPFGMTCNSFASLSLDPPLVQWSIAKTSRSYATVCTLKHFAVHVLDAAQSSLSRQFASKDQDRFEKVEIETGLHDLPLLTRFHARFECATHSLHDAGDHTIVIGQVLRLCEQEGDPLIFYRGAFSGIASNG